MRYAKEIPLRFHSGDKQIEAIATDLNEHGMFIRTREPFTETPTLLELQIAGRVVRAVVEPRYVGPSLLDSGVGVGVEIVQISEQDRESWFSVLR